MLPPDDGAAVVLAAEDRLSDVTLRDWIVVLALAESVWRCDILLAKEDKEKWISLILQVQIKFHNRKATENVILY